jgi:hypothetical protein
LIDDDLLALLVAKGWLYRPAKEQVSWLPKLPIDAQNVTSISLSRTRVTDVGFKVVADCVNTEYLGLRETQITDATVVAAGQAFPKLRSVNVAKTKVTGEGVKALAAVATINRLDVGGCELDEGAFRAIGAMKKLRELNLTGAKFQPEWIKHLAGGSELKELNVENTALDDAASKTVAAVAPNLEILTARSTQLGDAGLKELAGLTKLRSLYNDNTPATKAGVEAFRKAHPKCFVSFGGR